jgi:hypothetical protein
MSTVLRPRTPTPSRSRPRAPRRGPVVAVSAGVAALAACALALAVAFWPSPNTGSAPPPSAAPAPVPVSGSVTLVSFLATQPDGAATPSRSQAVELVSLSSQYAAKGLHVEIVDDTATPAAQTVLENTVYDWQLGSMPLLADPGHAVAHRYGITTAPTTLLIGRTGAVLARWNGYVLTAVAAQAIASAL